MTLSLRATPLRAALAAAAALLLAATPLRAQQFEGGIQFNTRFDNREYSDTAFNDASQTLFGMELCPYAGLNWGGRNTLTAAVDMWRHFGDNDRFLSSVDLYCWYKYEAPKVVAAAGIFDRALLAGEYGELIFDEGYAFYNNAVQGLTGRYRSEHGFVELALDWQGLQSAERREQFRILSAGSYVNGLFYGGYTLLLSHYAKTSQPVEGEGVVDYLLVNPHIGVRFTALLDFDLRAGFVQTLHRDRIADEGWLAPRGGQFDVRIGYKGLLLRNTLYAGDGLMPLYDKYGAAFYTGNVFYRMAGSLYNRTEVGYRRRFFGDTLGVRAGFVVHCDGNRIGLQQIVEVNVLLQKKGTRRGKAAENR